MEKASLFSCSKAVSAILISAGIFLPAFFVFAQTSDTPPSVVNQEQVYAAIVDLSEIYGQPVTSVEQAKAICNLEQYLGDCAEIGKRHDLFEANEIKSVDAVLSELKGKLIDDLKNCADETCLVGVASQLAKRLADKAPAVAKELDLTTKKVAEKNEIVKAAKEVGVNFDDCRTMDPDSASVELLRACAKLAKHKGVQQQLSIDARQAVENQDASLELQEGLRIGAYQCGDNTLEGCGNYCLNPSAGTAIPPVCRDIAQKFFGSEGVKQLDLARSQVQQTAVNYLKKAKNVVFVTLDGKKLTSPEAIGRYMEEAGRTGNVEAVGKGMDFLVSKGFVKPEEKDFALRMVQKIKDQGGRVDFDECSRNPAACDRFIHEDDRGEFAAQDKVHSIIEAAINQRGVPGAQSCSDPKYSETCHEATRSVLPQLRQLVAQSPETKTLVAEIESRFVDANRGFEARRDVENKFQGGEQLKIGDRTFSNFQELEVFCRTNSSACLAETARQGFIDRDYAAQKYEYSFETQRGAFPEFVPPGQGGLPPGRTPGFTSPGPGFGLPPSINKEDALKQFQAWLDNPQGPPPVPNQQVYLGDGPSNYPYPYSRQACPQIYPRPCSEGQYRVDSRDNQGCFIPGECSPIPGYVPRRQTTCPQPVEPACSAGQYSRFVRGLDGCYVSECVSGEQRPQPIGQVCPAQPTVSGCPAGEEKYVSYSSRECGTYFACRKSGQFPPPPLPPVTQCSDGIDNDGDGQIDYPADTGCYGRDDYNETTPVSPEPFPIPTPTACPSGQYWYVPSGGGAGYCKATSSTDCPSGQYWNGSSCVTSTPSPTACDSALINLLGSGCHQMYSDASGQSVFCDGPMTKSARRGETTATLGCSQTGGGSSTLQSCFYPNASINSQPPGFTVWCEKDYFNCHKGSPSGEAISLTGLSLGAPSSCESGWTDGGGISPAGQKEQIWNSFGLKSWIRTDADPARIEQLKQSCVNVSSNANVWSPDSGNSTSVDFGMPNADKCQRAASCTSSQYFDGAACVTTTTPQTGTAQCSDGRDNDSDGQIDYPADTGCYGRDDNDEGQSTTTSGSCTQELINLLGSGCHSMGNGLFNGAMNRYVLSGTTVVKECSTNYISGCTSGGSSTTCSSGQYWYVPSGGGAGYCKATSSTDCPSGQWWDSATNSCKSTSTPTTCPSGQYLSGSSCVNSTTTSQCSDGIDNDGDGQIDYPADTGCYSATDYDEIVPPSTTSSCPSFAHDMGGYCMLNNDTSRCAEYSTASSDSGYTASTCQQRSGTTTSTGTTSGSCPSGQYWNGYSCVASACPSGQYWYVPSGGGAGYCKATSSTDCPSGQWWDSAISSCRSTSSTTNTCSSDQYWNGSSCVSNSPTNTTPTCSSGQYWDSSRSSCVGTCSSDQSWDVNTQSCKSNSTTTCSSDQYWNGTSCVSNTPTTTTTTCSSGQYWNGSACVNTSPSDTPPPSAMLLPQNCPGSHYWDGDSCVFGTKKNVLHFIAEVRTSLNGFMGWLMRVLLK